MLNAEEFSGIQRNTCNHKC